MVGRGCGRARGPASKAEGSPEARPAGGTELGVVSQGLLVSGGAAWGLEGSSFPSTESLIPQTVCQTLGRV